MCVCECVCVLHYSFLYRYSDTENWATMGTWERKAGEVLSPACIVHVACQCCVPNCRRAETNAGYWRRCKGRRQSAQQAQRAQHSHASSKRVPCDTKQQSARYD